MHREDDEDKASNRQPELCIELASRQEAQRLSQSWRETQGEA